MNSIKVELKKRRMDWCDMCCQNNNIYIFFIVLSDYFQSLFLKSFKVVVCWNMAICLLAWQQSSFVSRSASLKSRLLLANVDVTSALFLKKGKSLSFTITPNILWKGFREATTSITVVFRVIVRTIKQSIISDGLLLENWFIL